MLTFYGCVGMNVITDSFINIANLATIGAHGSCDGIVKGRGRSPQNWAFILGANKFKISLFKITSGIDEGDVISLMNLK